VPAASPAGASSASARASASSVAALSVRGGASTSAPARSPSPKGFKRRVSSGPSSSPDTIAESTSPARRRSVSWATRRRSNSSATIVTA
jgi:hypothetical protein